ncbi:MAG: S1 RNA-binding domain-containing protein [Oscillospiraceae bacterium]|nr:S1 RNA-binding domain-containing protein [Oscillospiraceae bacterium]
MQPEVGKIYEGKVTSITKFGAFVELEPGVTGMVHISEVANTFVNEIKDHLAEGQEVKVKVLSVSEEGKISLSIKKAEENPGRDRKQGSGKGSGGGNSSGKYGGNGKNSGNGKQGGNGKPGQQEKVPQTPEAAFEDMLNKFKQSSDERMGDLKKVIDNKRRSPSRRK